MQYSLLFCLDLELESLKPCFMQVIQKRAQFRISFQIESSILPEIVKKLVRLVFQAEKSPFNDQVFLEACKQYEEDMQTI